jgi:hypothetical protein
MVRDVPTIYGVINWSSSSQSAVRHLWSRLTFAVTLFDAHAIQPLIHTKTFDPLFYLLFPERLLLLTLPSCRLYSYTHGGLLVS